MVALLTNAKFEPALPNAGCAMLEAVARVLIWLCVGEILMRLALIPMPSPVIGLVLLYLDLLWHGRLPEDLGRLADRMLSLFGLLFVPAGVGLVAHVDVLRAEAVSILAAIVGGTVVTLLATIATTMLFQSWTRQHPPAQAFRTVSEADRHA